MFAGRSAGIPERMVSRAVLALLVHARPRRVLEVGTGSGT